MTGQGVIPEETYTSSGASDDMYGKSNKHSESEVTTKSNEKK
jgi:hypothetical protein